jgi:hypothetical protein
MSIMDQVKKNLREWYALAADRTGDMAKISVRMYDKYGISREIERQLSELGSYVYHAVEEGRTDFAGDEEFQAWYDRIKGLEHDLDAKVDEIEEIRRARAERQAARERAEAEAAAAAAAAGATEDGEEAAATEARAAAAGEAVADEAAERGTTEETTDEVIVTPAPAPETEPADADAIPPQTDETRPGDDEDQDRREP